MSIFKTNYISCISPQHLELNIDFESFPRIPALRSVCKSLSSLLETSLEFFPFYNKKKKCFFSVALIKALIIISLNYFSKLPNSLCLCHRFGPWSQFIIPSMNHNYTRTLFAMWCYGTTRIGRVYFPTPLMLSWAIDLLWPMKCGKKWQ